MTNKRMTNKEAIKKLKEQQAEFNENYVDFAGVNTAYDLAIKALEDVASLKRAIILLAVGGIPPEKQLIDFGYTREDWVYMLKTVMEIIEENIICANSEDSKGNNNGNDNNLV